MNVTVNINNNVDSISDPEEQVTICHVTPSGQQQTLTLPKSAAETHLTEHPNDYAGECRVKTSESKESQTE